MKWFYYGDNGKRVGPFGDDEFKRLAQTGVILPSTTVENEDGRRALAERVAGLFPSKAGASREWETRFQRLTETVVEGGNIVDGKMNDLSRRLNGVAQTSGDLARRLSELETLVGGMRSGGAKRVAEFERKGDASGDWSKRLDALETSFGAARFELTKRVAELEKKDGASGDLSKRLDALETSVNDAFGDWTKRLDAVKKSLGDASGGLTKRVADVEKQFEVFGDVTAGLKALEKRFDVNVAATSRLLAVEGSVGAKVDGLMKCVDELEKKGASGDLAKRLDALETSVGDARSGLTKRVAELEKKGGASGDLAKRLDALETSLGGARSGLTQRVAELEKKGGASSELTKRLEAVEKQCAASNGVAVRLAAVEKSSDAKVGGLLKRVEEVENRVDANSAWARRLDTSDVELAKRVDVLEEGSDGDLTRRLNQMESRFDSCNADLSRRTGVFEKRVDSILDGLAKRFQAVEAALETKIKERDQTSGIAAADALARLNQTLETFNLRLERLTERIDSLERRFDENNALDELILEDAEFDERDIKFNEPEPEKEEERDGGRANGVDNEENASAKARPLNAGKGIDGKRFNAGAFLVGDDLPAGRYRVEIWQNWASIEVEIGENYRCCVLEANGDIIDGYDSFGVVELPEGATVTLDNPVDFTYLGALS